MVVSTVDWCARWTFGPPNRTGQVVSVTDVVVSVEPRISNRVVTMTVVGVVRVTCLQIFGQLDGPSGHGEDHGFVLWTSEFLTEWTWTIVTTVVCDGTSGSCPLKLGDHGGDPGLSTG